MAKADIFSLGMSVYEAATLIDLPKNGPEWHKVLGGKTVRVSICNVLCVLYI